MANERMLSVDELADRLDVHAATIYRWRDSGELPEPAQARPLKWREKDIDAWENAHLTADTAEGDAGELASATIKRRLGVTDKPKPLGRPRSKLTYNEVSRHLGIALQILERVTVRVQQVGSDHPEDVNGRFAHALIAAGLAEVVPE